MGHHQAAGRWVTSSPGFLCAQGQRGRRCLAKHREAKQLQGPLVGSCTPLPSGVQPGAVGCRGMGCRVFLICMAKSAPAESLSSTGRVQREHNPSCALCHSGTTQRSFHQELFRSRELLSYLYETSIALRISSLDCIYWT